MATRYTRPESGGSGEVATIVSGEYQGDSTDNKAIPHGLGKKPKFIEFERHDFARYIKQIRNGYVEYVYDGGLYSLAVTEWDETNFYVGNSLSYSGSANHETVYYYWVAIG